MDYIGRSKRIPSRIRRSDLLRMIRSDRELLVYTLVLLAILTMGGLGEHLAPYEYNERHYDENGDLMRAEPPSLDHPLGTTNVGYDVLSRVIIGATPTMITGVLGGALIITLGTTVGVSAGYLGGTVDSILMRFTDFIYGVPMIPFAIVLLALMGFGQMTTILAIGLILWRASARVLRSQVLQIKERPFVMAAKATGMSEFQIIRKHILPNIAPMMILYLSLGIGYSIIVQAGLAFIGVSNPFVPSWGVMIRNAYDSGVMHMALWWSIPPGLLISITVLSAFMFGRKYEELSSGKLGDKALAA